jgi:hypothetical protein
MAAAVSHPHLRAQTDVAAKNDAVLPGTYFLKGVREVGAELRLTPEGRFEFGVAFGGAEGTAQGRWQQRGRLLMLDTDKPPPAGFILGQERSELLGDYGNEPDKPTLLVVRVSTPRLGLTWSNMEISADFSNGQTRQGVTGNSGMLGFLLRTEPQWQGATVQRVSVAYPKGKVGPAVFIPKRETKGLELHFEPGALVAAAFTQAVLQVDKAGRAAELRVVSGDLGQVGWRFVRQP